MKKIIEYIRNWFSERCWHDFEQVSGFRANTHLGLPIRVLNEKCNKCGQTNIATYRVVYEQWHLYNA